jgi:dihydroorotase-like cyclic amidohydrolase
VFTGGRVVDPETGLDAIRNVAISDGKIVAISSDALPGKETIDVGGLVVAPGFINLHSHSWTPMGNRFEVQDGVTTILELESGAYPAAEFATHDPVAIAGKARTNYGASLGHAWVRSAILEGDEKVTGFDEMLANSLTSGDGFTMARPAFESSLTADQIDELKRRLEEGLDNGGLGIGMLLDYMSEAVGEDEMQAIFEVAGRRGAPIFVHIRRGVAGDPAGLLEVIRIAKKTGAPVHVVHIQASAMNNIAEFMRLVREANTDRVRITMEAFPYNAGSTSISAAVFSRNWQEVFAITYEDIEWVQTGERLTEETWNKYRAEAPGGTVVHHYNREEWTRQASLAPDVITAADGTPILSLDVKAAPFGVGTFSRMYAKYVREEGSLSLMDAVSKMTLLPARVLENYSEAFRHKGRVQVGADADLTIFSLEDIQDNATFQEPYKASTGIAHVVVGGQFALRDGQLLENSFPGKRILK